MGSKLTQCITIILWLLLVVCRSTIITPTYAILGKEIYNTTLIEEFKSHKIICGDTVCHIVCDTDSGCYNTTVDASASDDLVLECTKDSSCYGLKIKKPPQLSANILWYVYKLCL